MALTLEQKRAADAWNKAKGCSDAYSKLAKSLPALIMNSGLMQVLAFLHEKGGKGNQVHCKALGDDLREWLCKRFPRELPKRDFADFMTALTKIENPRTFQEITTEAFAWLRWSRQMAAAVQVGVSPREI
ncbi:MAG: hypothetical protein RLZZ182_2706 [Pseudomonadota bacterium]|jgi:CRISPR-associated protein Cmr5